MKELHFEYHMKLVFDRPVEKHRFTLKCVPCSSERQEIRDLSVQVTPHGFLSETGDAFGNVCLYGSAPEKHDSFEVSVEGLAKTGLSSSEKVTDESRIGMYRYPTELTKAGTVIRVLAEVAEFPEGASNLVKAKAYMKALRSVFRYHTGATDVNTTAEEALMLGGGVCQDFTHILLALCRLERIPCRYVAGIVIGEGASHAWAEILDDGHWIALDPTNDLVVDDLHIKMSVGRDYRDCMLDKGLFVGFTEQRQEIRVCVNEKTEE